MEGGKRGMIIRWDEGEGDREGGMRWRRKENEVG